MRASAQIPGRAEAINVAHSWKIEEERDYRDHRLWPAAVVEPADCGENPVDDEHTRPRKLRPLAQRYLSTELLGQHGTTNSVDPRRR